MSKLSLKYKMLSLKIKEVVVKDDVTNKDIAKAICNLSIDELKSLKDKIETLELIKITKKELKLEKDNI